MIRPAQYGATEITVHGTSLQPSFLAWGVLWVLCWLALRSGLVLDSIFTEAALVGAPLAIWGRTRRSRALVASLLVPLAIELSAYWLLASPLLLPHTYDNGMMRLDAMLSRGWSGAYAVWVQHHPIVWWTNDAIYWGQPIALIIAWRVDGIRVLIVAAIGAVLATIGTVIVPATGPFYWTAGLTHIAPRNAIPSLHFGWSLIIAAALWPYRPWRVPVALLVVGTISATIGGQEHYIIDLLAAVPLAITALRLPTRAGVLSCALLLLSLGALRVVLTAI